MGKIENISDNTPTEDISELSEAVLSIVARVGNLASRLLSNATSLEKVIPRPFRLTKTRVRDLYDTIEHKLKNTPSEETSFKISVHYDDDTFEEYPSIRQFEESHETGAKIARSLRMVWDIVAKFDTVQSAPLGKIGERQSISIVFSTPPPSDSMTMSFYLFNDRPVKADGVCLVAVEHSNKIWATEVIGHVEDFTKRIAIKASKVKLWAEEKKQVLADIASRIVRVSPVIPFCFAAYRLIHSEDIDIRAILLLMFAGLILRVLVTTLSHPFERLTYRILARNRLESVIVLNNFTANEIENSKPKGALFFSFLLIVVIPLSINIFTIWIASILGIE